MRRRRWAAAVAAATLLALALRLVALRPVALNPFYDAAVRSMGLSWHNFFYGAFDPAAQTSIDKPPLDLWLQVASVKLLGFEPLALKLPAALAAGLAVPLLYDTVRRVFGPAHATLGRTAGLLAGLSLAVMPVSVLTSRSDTMDSLMMALLVLAAWLIVRSGESGRLAPLLLAGAVLGLAFNVKLLEIAVALPALAVLAWLLPSAAPSPSAGGGDGHSRKTTPRARGLVLAGCVFVATALSWITIVSLTPGGDRPYALGSTDGSVWSSVFVFDGTERLLGRARPQAFGGSRGGVRSAPSPVRLLAHEELDYGGLVGVLLLGALLLGGLALWVCRPVLWERTEVGGRRVEGPRVEGRGRLRATRAGAGVAAVAVWLGCGLVLFSFTARLHPRYLEAFTPAIAAALGAGLAALGFRAGARPGRDGRSDPRAVGALGVGVGLCGLEVLVAVEGESIQRAGALIALAAVLVLILAGALATLGQGRTRGWLWWWGAGSATALAAVAVLTFPLARSVGVIRTHASDEALSPSLHAALVSRLSAFLRAHQDGARYELAASAPTLAAPMIVRDARPVLLLEGVNARALLTIGRLQDEVRRGEVRYVLTHGRCPRQPNHELPACSPIVEWVRAHGVDVTAQLAYPGERAGLLYELRAPAA